MCRSRVDTPPLVRHWPEAQHDRQIAEASLVRGVVRADEHGQLLPVHARSHGRRGMQRVEADVGLGARGNEAPAPNEDEDERARAEDEE